jgi:hypothetical protein
MKWKHSLLMVLVALLSGDALRAEEAPLREPAPASPPAVKSSTVFDLQSDRPGQLTFLGSATADLFTKELSESMKGVLAEDYVSQPNDKFPLGFLNASPTNQPWYGTMWTRDAGTFMRELVSWGYYAHACQVAQCVIDYVGTNSDGFVEFPRFIDPQQGALSGSEMDGQAATIMSMISLRQRLSAKDPFRARLYEFLHQQASPLRGMHFFLEHGPLVPGSGEFGGGKGHDNYNVIQNNLCALAFLSAADMEDEAGDRAIAKTWRNDAKTIFGDIEKYLVNKRGAWIWGIEMKTMQPNSNDVDSASNSGGGGLNGVICMSADVLGYDPTDWPWQGAVSHGEKTFEDLYHFPLRKEQFDKYGFWAQMNYTHKGLLTSPSYGQGYALQDMLLMDKIDMAEHGLEFLAEGTYKAPHIIWSLGKDHYQRSSPYYFYERMYSPDALGKIELTAGCGPLNLVNVSEPLKVGRLIAGVDDTSPDEVKIIPRVPASWSGYRMENWPVCTSHGVVRADISCEKKDGKVNFTLQVKQGGAIPKLSVRLPEKQGTVWKTKNNVEKIEFTSVP